jgi:ABC-2 type transport system ATP-binding protein
MTYTVEASDITKTFGEHRALDGVDLRIEGGSVFALLAPTGRARRRWSTSSPR